MKASRCRTTKSNSVNLWKDSRIRPSTIRRRTLPLFDANWSGTETRSNGKPLHTSIDGIHIILFAAFGNQQTGSWNDDVITSPSVRPTIEGRRIPASCHFSKTSFRRVKATLLVINRCWRCPRIGISAIHKTSVSEKQVKFLSFFKRATEQC